MPCWHFIYHRHVPVRVARGSLSCSPPLYRPLPPHLSLIIDFVNFRLRYALVNIPNIFILFTLVLVRLPRSHPFSTVPRLPSALPFVVPDRNVLLLKWTMNIF